MLFGEGPLATAALGNAFPLFVSSPTERSVRLQVPQRALGEDKLPETKSQRPL